MTNDNANSENVYHLAEQFKQLVQTDKQVLNQPTITKSKLGVVFTATQQSPILKPMTVTREEIDAKLEASESRIETKLVSMEGKFDVQFATLNGTLDAIKNDLTATRAASDEARKASQSVIWQLIGFVVAIVGLVIAAYVLGFDMHKTIAEFLANR